MTGLPWNQSKPSSCEFVYSVTMDKEQVGTKNYDHELTDNEIEAEIYKYAKEHHIGHKGIRMVLIRRNYGV